MTRIVVLEPTAEEFVSFMHAQILELCQLAEANPTRRYRLAFPSKQRLEPVRQLIDADPDAPTWSASSGAIVTSSQRRVLAGRDVMHGMTAHRVVIVCSGKFPDERTMVRVSASGLDDPDATALLVFDPEKPPTHEKWLRCL